MVPIWDFKDHAEVNEWMTTVYNINNLNMWYIEKTAPSFEGLRGTAKTYKYINILYTNGFVHLGQYSMHEMTPLYLASGYMI